MDIPPLLELSTAKIATFIKGKTSAQMREILEIPGWSDPVAEKKAYEENAWVFGL
jgi:hypothetical protein